MLANPRHEQFAQAFAITGNAAESWRQAGGSGKNGNVLGSRWLAKVDIAGRITEIRSAMEKGFTMTREEWLQRLRDNADASRTAKDRSAERQALREIGLAMPWYSPEQKKVAVETTPVQGPTMQALLESQASLEAIARAIQDTPGALERLQAILAA